MYLYCGVAQTLEESSKETKVKTFKKSLQRLADEIKLKYRDSIYRETIRKIFKEEISKITSLAEEVAEGSSFVNGKLSYDLLDGIPLTKSPILHRSYDLVIKQDPSHTKVLVFTPDASDEFDPVTAQIQAEQDFDIPCIEVKTHREFPTLNIRSKKETEKPITKSIKSNIQTINAKKITSSNQFIGKVLFSKKDQFILRAEQDKDEIKGFLFEEHNSTVKPLDILVLENLESQKKIYARVSKMGVNPLSGGGYVRQFAEVATHVLFRPVMEVSSDWKGRVRPSDLTGFMIRRPTSKELNEVLSIPGKGLPIGRLDYDGSNEVFLYPMVPEDTIYQSMLVAGVQGKGKTNFLKLTIRALATNANVGPTKRPAIVILDREGEYTEFAKKSEMDDSAQEFLEKYGMGEVIPKVYTVNVDSSKSDATLPLRAIDKEGIIYLLPELESKTENILRVLLNRVTYQLETEKAPQDIETLRNRLLAENNNSQLIHMQQRPAIARAILSPSLNLLDQKGKTPITPHLLFKPGTISIINYKGMDQNMKRVVALYLLQMLDKYKMNESNIDPGVLLIIDEAELLFPESPSKGDKDYVQRIEARMQDITNRGRKHKYGVVLVTHLPSAVSRQVGDLANTKVAFGCSGADKWVRDYFGRDYVDEINGFPTGVCRISVKVNSASQGPINARIRIPYVGNKEVLADTGVDGT
jgi:hypothetical protein